MKTKIGKHISLAPVSGKYASLAICVQGNAILGEKHITVTVPLGSVLGPLLFILYINYLPNKIESFLRLYANDVILYREIQIEQDVIRLQKDLDTITRWAETWLMKLNKV